MTSVFGVVGSIHTLGTSATATATSLSSSLAVLYKTVALVVSPGLVGVLAPRLHANPAEVVAAPLASHVVAPVVFFDERLALRALFGVGS